MKAARWIAAAAILLAFAALVSHRGAGRPGRLTPPGERRIMPALEMAQLSGGLWRLAGHRGQVVVVNYWASWCEPCWEETPGLVRLSQERSPSVAVVGVAMDEGGQDKVKSFVERFHVLYPIALPAKGSQIVYGMDGLPQTILVDRQGRVARTYSGAVNERDLRSDVSSLLAEK